MEFNRQSPAVPLVVFSIAAVSMVGNLAGVPILSTWCPVLVDQKITASIALMVCAVIEYERMSGRGTPPILIGFVAGAVFLTLVNVHSLEYQARSISPGVPSWGTLLALAFYVAGQRSRLALLCCAWVGAAALVGYVGYYWTRWQPFAWLYWGFKWSTDMAIPTALCLVLLGRRYHWKGDTHAG